MPEPTENETREEFIERCIPVVLDDGTAEDSDQAVAVCNSMWEQADKGNALKAISTTADELRVGNYIVLFNTKDLEGYGSKQVNADGSRGEYFTPDTVLESDYTKAGAVFVDWEHNQDEDPKLKEPITEVLGVVDWKTARTDDKGVFVERVLNRRSRYVQFVQELIEAGLVGTSSEAVQSDVEKSTDGRITRWPIRRDTLTVQPMEFRMMKEFGQNHLQAFKALGVPVPNDTGGPEQQTEAQPDPEPEASPEADTSAVDVAKARARLQRFRNSLLEEQ